MNVSESQNRYSHNVIINMGGSPCQVEVLKERMKNQNYLGTEVTVLNLNADDLAKDVTEEDLRTFAKVDSHARIFIMDHGLPNSAKIGGKHFSDLADYLAARLDADKLKGGDHNLRINLIPCFAARGDNGCANSFAARFHNHLAEAHGIKAEVTGRTRIVMVNALTPHHGILTTTSAHYFDTVKPMCEKGVPLSGIFPNPSDYHRIAGTKYTFKWEKDQQILVDSYIENFGKRTGRFIKMLKDNVEESRFHLIEKNVEALEERLSDFSVLSYSTVKQIEKELESIKQSLSSPKDDLLLHEIVVLLKQSQKEISQESANAHRLGRRLNSESPKTYESFNAQVKRRIFDPGVAALKEMAKTENERPIKRLVSQFLQYVGDQTGNKLRDDKPFDLEEGLAKSVVSIIETLNSKEGALAKRKGIGALRQEAKIAIENHYKYDKENVVAQQYVVYLNVVVKEIFGYLDQF